MKNKKYVDHLGNEFDRLEDLAEYYHVPKERVCMRLHRGWTIEEAVRPEMYERRKVPADKVKYPYTDHLGNKFRTIADLCKFHKLSPTTLRTRIGKGLSLEECLTGEYKYIDHLGNKFHNIDEMVKYWGTTRVNYFARISKYGMTQEEALTVKHAGTDRQHDHLGNEFRTQREMCDYWRVLLNTFKYRRKQGWSLEECLLGKRAKTEITEHTK